MIRGAVDATVEIAATFDRLRAADTWGGWLSAGLGAPPDAEGWISGDRLLEHSVLDDLLKPVMADHGATKKIAATWLVGEVAWRAGAAGLIGLVTERRAFATELPRVALRIGDEHRSEEVALQDPEVGVLRGDVLDALPEAAVFDSEDALRGWTRTRLRAHLMPLIEAVFEYSRMSRRALWGQAEDAWGGILLEAGKISGDAVEGRREAEGFFDAPGPPSFCRPTFYMLPLDPPYIGQRRGSCCLAYKTSTPEYCVTCPLIKDTERFERIRAELADTT
ncbi:MAG: hypothetical protein GEU71_14025 [Actinobacteria bacterium]|jgi:hypothetical protein|nr:hypothetical protein [Actinomycetota bacterium]